MQTETSVATKSASLRTLVPRVDIYEREGDIVLVADVPGATEPGVDIQLDRSTLTLTARAESLSLAWRRSFTLPRTIDADGVNAALKDGVLTLTLPRRAEDRVRRIAVTTA